MKDKIASIDAIEFVPLLGHYKGESLVDNFLSQIGPEHEFYPGETTRYLEYEDYGFCLYFEEREEEEGEEELYKQGCYILTAVMFYADGFQGYKGFKRDLPCGLRFSDSREKAREKLGDPVASGGGVKNKLLGHLPETDHFKLPGIDALIVVRYNLDNTKVDLVTFMKESPQQ
jgi:hypothetical protein